jgi:hypothetical protein
MMPSKSHTLGVVQVEVMTTKKTLKKTFWFGDCDIDRLLFICKSLELSQVSVLRQLIRAKYEELGGNG